MSRFTSTQLLLLAPFCFVFFACGEKDGDDNGEQNCALMDTNCDGVPDDLGNAVYVDGEWAEFDFDGDGRGDGLAVDVDFDGIADGVLLDLDGDGLGDAVDLNGDGQPDLFSAVLGEGYGGGSGGSSTGGMNGTGSTNSGGTGALTCVGNAPSGCDQDACDTVIGCEVIAASECTGTSAACSAYDDLRTECTAQIGCNPPISGICQAYDADCWDFDDAPDLCQAARGCDWQVPYCFGDINLDCDDRTTKTNCEDHSGCYWTFADKDYCVGTAVECEDLSASQCEAQVGCSLEPGDCSGTPTDCSDLSTSECLNQPGCRLSDGTTSRDPAETIPVGPDLVILSASAGRGVSGESEVLTFRLVETNRGSRIAGAHRNQFIASKNEEFGDDDDAELLGLNVNFEMLPYGFDQTANTVFNLAVTTALEAVEAGWYEIYAVTDYEEEVDELEEDNNVLYVGPLYIGPTVHDLVVTEASHDISAAVSPEDAFSVSFTVDNQGSAEVGSVAVAVYFSEDDVLDGGDVKAVCTPTVDLDVLPLEQTSASIDCEAPRARGDRYVIFVVDPEDTLGDEEPSNNSFVIPEEVSVAAPSPDYVVSELSLSSTSFEWKDSMDITAAVENTGPDAGPGTTVQFYLSTDDSLGGDRSLCSSSIAGVSAAGTVDASRSCTLAAHDIGDFYLLAVVDPQDDIFELSEANNSALFATPLSVAQPDFNYDVVDLGFDQTLSEVGGPFDVSFEVENGGSLEAPAFRMNVYASTDTDVTTDDTLLCYFQMPALSPGNYHLVTSENCGVPTIDAGDYYIGIIADPNDEHPETSESDNVRVVTSYRLTIE